jgi:hypothetical protein
MVTAGMTDHSRAYHRTFAVLLALTLITIPIFAFAQEPTVPLKQLDDQSRARVLAAVAALIILGFGMVLLTWLGARVTQRYRQGVSYMRPTPRPGEHDWAKRPLVPREPDSGHNPSSSDS